MKIDRDRSISGGKSISRKSSFPSFIDRKILRLLDTLNNEAENGRKTSPETLTRSGKGPCQIILDQHQRSFLYSENVAEKFSLRYNHGQRL